MGYVYLIGEEDIPNHYKIGSTKANNVQKRLRQLQTGNSTSLYLRDYFETDKPFKLEKMLHNRFKSSNLINEWFELSKDDVGQFKAICGHLQTIIDSLKDNPFY